MYYFSLPSARFILSASKLVSLYMFLKLPADTVFIFIVGMLYAMLVFVVTLVASLLVL